MLLPEKARLHLPRSRTLLVADAHIGKAVSFRSLGVPVPRGTTSETLARADARWSPTPARSAIVFLGDFLHSARSHAAGDAGRAARAGARAHAALELTLVRGNHDDRAGDPPAAPRHHAWSTSRCCAGRLRAVPPPAADAGRLRAGRPPASLRQRRRARASTACACRASGFGPAAVGVLPAFGAFTGMHPIRARRRRPRLRDRRSRADRARCGSGATPRAADGRAARTAPHATLDRLRCCTLITAPKRCSTRLEAVLPHPLDGARLERVDRVSLPQARRRAACSSRCATWRRSASSTCARSSRRRSAWCATPSSSSPASGANNVLLTGARGTGK